MDRRKLEVSGSLKFTPILGLLELGSSEVMAQVDGGAHEPFMSAIGTLLMAMRGRNLLWSLGQSSIFARASSRFYEPMGIHMAYFGFGARRAGALSPRGEHGKPTVKAALRG